MNRQHKTPFTHYTEITDAKQIDVRRMQTEVSLAILRVISTMVGKVFKRSARRKGVQVIDQA